MKQYELTKEQAKGLEKLIDWLDSQSYADLTGTIVKLRERVSFILIREYYSESERDLLNELRKQYFEDNKSK